MSDKSRRRTTEKRDEMAWKVPLESSRSAPIFFLPFDAFPHIVAVIAALTLGWLFFYPEIAGRGIIIMDHTLYQIIPLTIIFYIYNHPSNDDDDDDKRSGKKDGNANVVLMSSKMRKLSFIRRH
jgi:hypothetical protein